MKTPARNQIGRSIVFIVLFSAVIIIALLFLLISKLFLSGEEKAPVYTKRRDINPLPEILTSKMQYDRNGTWVANGATSIDDIETVCKKNSIERLKLKLAEMDAEKLRQFRNEPLEHCVIEKNRFDSAMMEEISNFQHLKFIKLGDTEQSLTDEVISKLTGPESLKTIYIDRGVITYKGIEHLSKTFKNLKGLNLNLCPMIDDKAAPVIFKSFPKLKELSFNSTKLTESGAALLSKKRGLHSLSLINASITDNGLKQFSRNLKSLDLSGTKITNASIVYLSKMKRLKTLKANSTGLTSKGFRTLETKLPKCNVLYPGRRKKSDKQEDKNAWIIDEYKGFAKNADHGYKLEKKYRESLMKKEPSK